MLIDGKETFRLRKLHMVYKAFLGIDPCAFAEDAFLSAIHNLICSRILRICVGYHVVAE